MSNFGNQQSQGQQQHYGYAGSTLPPSSALGMQQYSQQINGASATTATTAAQNGGNSSVNPSSNGGSSTVGKGGESLAGQAAQVTAAQQQQQQAKELNAASLCRFGQETVQEIVSRTQELYQTLRAVQPPPPPDGKQLNPALDRKPKFQETLRNIRALFKRVRIIYDKIGEAFPDSEDIDLEKSIPYVDPDNPDEDGSNCMNEKQDTDAYRQAMEEYLEVVEQVKFKNQLLRETMDLMRHVIWDVNTMLAMRKE